MCKFRILLFLVPFIAVAQLTPNSVTVTASRNTTPQPDVARFNISIAAPADVTRDDVLAAASGAGLTAANFTGLYSNYGGPNNVSVTWNFSMTTALANLKATLGLLTALQSNLAKDKKFALSFSISGSEVSPQSQSCTLADLIADARTQAGKLASAAGLSLGGVLALSSGVTGAAVSGYLGIGGVGSVSSPVCSVTVKFSLGGM
jgi:hypothetical protein